VALSDAGDAGAIVVDDDGVVVGSTVEVAAAVVDGVDVALVTA
jgi:hypothetical protein